MRQRITVVLREWCAFSFGEGQLDGAFVYSSFPRSFSMQNYIDGCECYAERQRI
jgi:hypothetical protein